MTGTLCIFIVLSMLNVLLTFKDEKDDFIEN